MHPFLFFLNDFKTFRKILILPLEVLQTDWNIFENFCRSLFLRTFPPKISNCDARLTKPNFIKIQIVEMLKNKDTFKLLVYSATSSKIKIRIPR